MERAQNIAQAVEALKAGRVVGLPTETVYGLAAAVSDDDAIARLFELKGRPADVPLPVAIGDTSWVSRVSVTQDPRVEALASRWWPGPLTIVCPARPDLNPTVTAGLGTVAMRIPATPITLAIIEAFGEPVALTSANAHGQPAARTRNEVSAYFPQGLAHVIDDGPSPIGVPSTIVSLKDSSRIHVLREGAVTEDEILDCLRHFEGLD